MRVEQKPRYEPGPTKRSMLVGAVCGAGGALAGQWLAPYLLAGLPQQPAWATPAIVIGGIGFSLLAWLLLPFMLRKRHDP